MSAVQATTQFTPAEATATVTDGHLATLERFSLSALDAANVETGGKLDLSLPGDHAQVIPTPLGFGVGDGTLYRGPEGAAQRSLRIEPGETLLVKLTV